MNCELAQERMVLAAWGELADEHVEELERHLAVCGECAAEREAVDGLQAAADGFAVAEPDWSLVARARMLLEEALDAESDRQLASGWWQQLRNTLAAGWGRLPAASVVAALLVVLGASAGAVGGYWGGYGVAMRQVLAATASGPAHAVQSAAANAPLEALTTVRGGVTPGGSGHAARLPRPAMNEVESISAIREEPDTHMVDVSYNQVVPHQVRGSFDDPSIQRLISLASQQAVTEGVRDNSVDVLAAECRARRGGCREPEVRNALMMALLYGQDPDVREKALQGLGPLVAEDTQVRNAILATLMNDSDPRIRTISINVLEPVEGDTSVREVLYTISNSDENPQIRNVSRQMLSHAPEIQ